MAVRRRGSGALLALIGAWIGLPGCGIPEAPELWTAAGEEGPPARAPAGEDWAFVAAGSYGTGVGGDEDDDELPVGAHQGPTVVYAGFRGEGTPERAFSAAELQEAGFTGFSAPSPAASFEGPVTEPRARAGQFQPLREVPR